jgi:hypothetical protein
MNHSAVGRVRPVDLRIRTVFAKTVDVCTSGAANIRLRVQQREFRLTSNYWGANCE